MIRFKHRYCQVHMAGYLSGDLPEGTRRRVARFIHECQDCYQEYRRQRALTERLQRNIPTLGQPSAQQLDKVWQSLQSQLVPASAPRACRPRRSPATASVSYGLIMIVLAVTLLLPLALDLRASLAAIDRPQVPPGVALATSPGVAPRMQAAIISTRSSAAIAAPSLKNTPVPMGSVN